MFNTGNCPSVPIVANLDGNNGNNWNDGSWLWFLIVVFAIFGGWGNGFGGFGGTNGGVGSEIQRGFDNQAVVSKLDGISNGLCDSKRHFFRRTAPAVKYSSLHFQMCIYYNLI